MHFIPAHDANFSRAANTSHFIIIHGIGGTHAGCIAWLQNPAAKVSYHYLVSKRGEVVRMVQDEHTAWHAGVSSWQEGLRTWAGLNQHAISIGLESMNEEREVYPDAQVRACRELCLSLMEKYLIPPCRVLTHNEISAPRKVDPVNFGINEFRRSL